MHCHSRQQKLTVAKFVSVSKFGQVWEIYLCDITYPVTFHLRYI